MDVDFIKGNGNKGNLCPFSRTADGVKYTG